MNTMELKLYHEIFIILVVGIRISIFLNVTQWRRITDSYWKGEFTVLGNSGNLCGLM